MDTLVSIGVLAAYLWSAIAVLFTNAGEHRHDDDRVVAAA